MASIRRKSAYAKNGYTYYPVVIVGAGESGIAMGCQLKEVLGFDQFRIFDRQSGIGGTWWINRYPGAACDMYVFSLKVFGGIEQKITNRRMQSGHLLFVFIRTEPELDVGTSKWPGNRRIFSKCLCQI